MGSIEWRWKGSRTSGCDWELPDGPGNLAGCTHLPNKYQMRELTQRAIIKWDVSQVWLFQPSSLRTHNDNCKPWAKMALSLKTYRDVLEDNEALEVRAPNGTCNITCSVAMLWPPGHLYWGPTTAFNQERVTKFIKRDGRKPQGTPSQRAVPP